MKEYQVCRRCVMDTVGDPNIRFDNHGNCNYCTEMLNILQSISFDCKEVQLEKQFDVIKRNCKDLKYDCLVGVSGGLDSSYIIYLGYKYGLRMLGIHIDDGLDTEVAKKNIKKLCKAANVDLISVIPDSEQYRDLTLSFFKACVPNLAIPQDNLILAALNDASKKYGIRYILHGSNFAMEGILQTGNSYTAADDKHIRAIQKQFSGKPINKLRLLTTFENSVLKRLRKDIITVKPLNMINYNFQRAISELKDFCDYNYYGGKHHESILTRFMQCYYLPEKFGVDKRKSHLSSLIISGQINREDALKELSKPGYQSEEIKESDFNLLAQFLGISREEFEKILSLPRKSHDDYPKSVLSNQIIPFLLRNRKTLHIRY